MDHQKSAAAPDNIVNAPAAPKPVGPYPHARRVGPFLYLSGVGPRAAGQSAIPGVELDDSGNMRSYCIETQCQKVFENVHAVLQEAGADLKDLVDVTVFLTDMKADFKTFNESYRRFFEGHSPCRTTVGVSSLPTPIAIELKCIAYLGQN